MTYVHLLILSAHVKLLEVQLSIENTIFAVDFIYIFTVK